jgi:hypothetical protein
VVVIVVMARPLREKFSNDEISAGVRDMVDNNLNVIQYRAKYGNTVSSLRLNYLISAYREGRLTSETVSKIMAL